jgi:hypothetical protein
MQPLTFTSGWTVEIDPAARRLTILKNSVLPWPALLRRKTIVNYCTFDEMHAVGTVPNDADDPRSFGVYLDFRGGREVIPVGALSEASRLATELSVATGIPRRDARSIHRPFWGHSSDD